MKNFLLLVIVCMLVLSCHRNRLKTDESQLAKEILTQEEQQERDRIALEKQLADSLAKLPKGFRFKEERGVDPQNPPLIIDVAGNLNNVRDFKLSDVASDVEYIRLEPVPDSTLSRDIRFKYYLMDNYLVAVNLFGIHLYSKEGRYIRSVVKNEFTGLNFEKENNRVVAWNDYTGKGGGTSVWARGNSLFYVYSNNIIGQYYIMEYDCSQEQSVINAAFDPEKPDQVIGLGQVLVDLRHGNKTPPPSRSHQGSWSASPEFFYTSLGTFAPDRNTYVKRMGGGRMLGIFGTGGDTLATFAKLEQVKNYTKSIMRGVDYGTQYEKGGNLFVRTDFNDTVFRVVPPNKLLPVYVFNLGSYKLSKQEGVDPGVNLEGKIIPQDFADIKDCLFFTFAKDSYDCPNTRKNKTLKLYHALFFKKSRQLFIVAGDPTDYDAPILNNDLDGGVAVWPLSYMINGKGEILVSLKGVELKQRVQSADFLNSAAPAEKKEKLKALATKLSDEDDVLMIVR